jgi:hypothetical protein
MATRSCPDWPELLDRAPDLHFKHYTAGELQLPHDVVVALGAVRLSELEICADTAHNVFYAPHTDPRLAGPLRASFWSDLDEWQGPAPA